VEARTTSASARRAPARPATPPWAAPAGAAAAAALALSSGWLPWYATQLGPVGAPGSTSGWGAGAIAVVGIALACLAGAAALVLALDAAQVIELDAQLAMLLAWAGIAAALVATALFSYRIAVLPAPAGFVSREIGVWVAALGAATAGVLLFAQLPARARAASGR